MSPIDIVYTAGKHLGILPFGREDVVQVVTEVWASHLLQNWSYSFYGLLMAGPVYLGGASVIGHALGAINQSYMSKHDSSMTPYEELGAICGFNCGRPVCGAGILSSLPVLLPLSCLNPPVTRAREFQGLNPRARAALLQTHGGCSGAETPPCHTPLYDTHFTHATPTHPHFRPLDPATLRHQFRHCIAH